MKTTLTKFIKSSSIPASLIRAVIWQIGDWQTFQEYAPDISKNGIDAGFPGFTYYNQTEPFAKAQKSAIAKLASSQAQELGYDSVFAMVRNFGCLKNDTFTDADLWHVFYKGKNPEKGPNLLNALAWYAAEEVARAYCDVIEAEN